MGARTGRHAWTAAGTQADFPASARAVWKYLNRRGRTVAELGKAGMQADPTNSEFVDRSVWYDKEGLDKFVAKRLRVQLEEYGTDRHSNPLYNATVSEISKLRKSNLIIDLNPGASNVQKGIWRRNEAVDLKIHERMRAEEEMESGNFYSSGSPQTVFVRRKQKKFRSILLEQYKRCLFCEFGLGQWMRGAHIVPYSIMRREAPEKSMDPSNGLLLCSTCDIAFEHGHIMADEDYHITVGDYLNSQEDFRTRAWLRNVGRKMHIQKDQTRYPPAPDCLRKKSEMLARMQRR